MIYVGENCTKKKEVKMKKYISKALTFNFSEIKVGTVFTVNNEPHIKVKEQFDNKGNIVNSLDSKGDFKYFRDSDKVLQRRLVCR